MSLIRKTVSPLRDNQLTRQFTAAESSKRKVLDREIILRAAGLNPDEVTVNDDHNAGRPSPGASPFRQCLNAQTTTSERIHLPNGSMASRVVL